MIRHLVMFRLRADEAPQRKTDAEGLKSRLEGLRDVVPGINSIKVFSDLGAVSTHWDVVLVADYATQADLDAYQVHPRHLEVVAWVNTVVADRAVVDYEAD